MPETLTETTLLCSLCLDLEARSVVDMQFANQLKSISTKEQLEDVTRDKVPI